MSPREHRYASAISRTSISRSIRYRGELLPHMGWWAVQAITETMPDAYISNRFGSRLELHNGQST